MRIILVLAPYLPTLALISAGKWDCALAAAMSALIGTICGLVIGVAPEEKKPWRLTWRK